METPLTKTFIVGGGGPNGLYLALELLRHNADCRVIVAEKRAVQVRRQVLAIGFNTAVNLPEKVKEALWDKGHRETLFAVQDKTNRGIFPKFTHIKYAPFMCIAHFQEVLLKYLESNYPGRFGYIHHDMSMCARGTIATADCIKLLEVARPVLPDLFCGSLGEVAFFSATGGGSPSRKLWDAAQSGSPYEFQHHGIIVNFQSPTGAETYMRNGEPVVMGLVGKTGILPACANNPGHFDVQLYTTAAPGSYLTEHDAGWSKLSESLRQRMKYRGGQPSLTLANGADLLENDADKAWFKAYASAIVKACRDWNIALPDLSKVTVNYAERGEYYFDKAALHLQGETEKYPAFYVGDASGGTDWSGYGVSLSRGLESSTFLASLIHRVGLDHAVGEYNTFWEDVIIKEFNLPSGEQGKYVVPHYKYRIKGRSYRDKGGKIVTYTEDKFFEW
eukprot:CAMPEP_0203746922 /NCGR_PEP_ID=MMETSP0098-20131031/2210_1 /ASSEMBLY_ACC=CAM_ASM_000208 /TAXON_ID=96639 /ORGANISM=" , Strain NY0313808BC1" /LENGTH=446 /DNA_ID=CAMNT_0050635175 /DNA_START=237 /DNA_END=1574 /DNA_ORIENTATION=-